MSADFNECLSIILALASVYSLLIFVLQIREVVWGYSSTKWPSTIGKVISSDLEKFIWLGDSDAPPASPHHFASITYEYSVKSTKYSGNRISFPRAYSRSKGRIDRHLDNYSPGEAVTVYYRPDRPESSVLIPGYSQSSESTWSIVSSFSGFVILAMIVTYIQTVGK